MSDETPTYSSLSEELNAKEYKRAPVSSTVHCPHLRDKLPKPCQYLMQQKKWHPNDMKGNVRQHARGKATVGPRRTERYKFRGDDSESDAVVHDVTVNGKTIPIMRSPKCPHPTDAQIAASLETLPQNTLNSVSTVEVTHNDAKGDDGKPTRDTYADCNGSGHITVYPSGQEFTGEKLDGMVNHEAGHALGNKVWGFLLPEEKRKWRDCRDADDNRPSEYAWTSVHEDIAEFACIYALAKGTPCEKYAKQIYPNRFAMFESYLQRDPKHLTPHDPLDDILNSPYPPEDPPQRPVKRKNPEKDRKTLKEGGVLDPFDE